jgi:hypothetical protein
MTDFTPTLGDLVTFTDDIFAKNPMVTPLANGSFVLAWESGDDILARQLSRQGAFIGGDFLSTLSLNDTNPLSSPRVIQRADGRVVVVYQEKPGNVLWHLVNADFSPDGNFSPLENPAVLMDSVSTTGGGGAVLYQLPDSGGQTSTTLRFIDSDGNNTSGAIVLTTTQPGSTPAVAMAGLQNGNVVVVHDANFVINCRLYAPDGSEIGPEVQLSQGPLAAFPDVAVLKDGSFVAVWQENNGGTFQIVYRCVYGIFADGVVATPPVAVPNSSGALDSGGGLVPQIAALNDGGLLIGWHADLGVESDGTPNEDIFLQRFDFENNVLQPIGTRVQVAEPGDQNQFSIATLRGGISIFDQRVMLAYKSVTSQTTGIQALNYRFIGIPPILIVQPPPPPSCQAEKAKVAADQQKIQNLKGRIATLQTALEDSPATEKQILKDIAAAETQLDVANDALAADQQALQVCLSTP